MPPGHWASVARYPLERTEKRATARAPRGAFAEARSAPSRATPCSRFVAKTPGFIATRHVTVRRSLQTVHRALRTPGPRGALRHRIAAPFARRAKPKAPRARVSRSVALDWTAST